MVIHATPLKSFSKRKETKIESMMTMKSNTQLLKKIRKKFINFLTLMLQTCYSSCYKTNLFNCQNTNDQNKQEK